MKKVSLEIVVFICGTSIMIMELVGSRIIAPYAGTSIFVWTSLIGVILAALSLGYSFGGIWADRSPRASLLSLIILASAFYVAAVAIVHDPLLAAVDHVIKDVRLAAVTDSLLLFAVPSTLLGMVVPFAAKLKIHSLEQTGATVGRLYALSTIGSITGTFLAGFVLMSFFGNTLILLTLSVFLTLASMLAWGERRKAKTAFLCALLVMVLSSDLLAGFARGPQLIDVNTTYNRVWIYEWPGPEKIKILQINDEFSSMKKIGSSELYSPYTRYYRLCAHFCPDLKNSLMLGGAGYSYPQDFLASFADATIDVVEIDPGVTDLARRHFDLKDDPRLTIHHQDARTYLNRNSKIYDAVLCDVFRSSSIPFHVTTLEAARKISDALSDRGVFIGNIISSIEGKSGQFLRAEVATLKKVFPQVYVFAVQERDSGDEVQNLIVVALKSKEAPKFYSSNPEWHEYLQHLWIRPIAQDEPVLTDDLAPVERYTFGALQSLGQAETPVFRYWREKLEGLRKKS